MKKLIYFLTLIVSFTMMMSCATAITTVKNVPAYVISSENDSVKMDFIGFKADANILSTSSSVKLEPGTFAARQVQILSPFDQWKAIHDFDALKGLGKKLEGSKIAEDKSFAYFGIYSLQELELYKTKNRYVSFVEVTQNKLSYEDHGLLRSNICTGAGLAGLSCGLLFYGLGSTADPVTVEDENLADFEKKYGIGCMVVGALFTLLALPPTTCETKFEGEYNIYVYDTVKKEIIRKEVVKVDHGDKWEGSFSHPDTNKDVLYSYYSSAISNALLRKYDGINKWISTLE
ncbi:MAG: hypothetical protein KBS64_04860 [Treponema sp.]|nr:hypothetical protein [Candidatus Treponema equi]